MRRVLASVVLVLVSSSACGTSGGGGGSGSATAGSAAAGAALVALDGWWEVRGGKGADEGGSLKFAANEMIGIGKDGRVFVRACKTTMTGTQVTTTGCGPITTGTLKGDTLEFPEFSATRVAKARADELERLAAAQRPPADTCARALRCLRAINGKEDPKSEAFELGGPPHHLSNCEGYLKGIVELEDQLPKPLPAECK